MTISDCLAMRPTTMTVPLHKLPEAERLIKRDGGWIGGLKRGRDDYELRICWPPGEITVDDGASVVGLPSVAATRSVIRA